VSSPRIPRNSTRQRRTEAYRAEWKSNRIGSRKHPRIRGPELVLALERALEATGDRVFADALRAVHHYGLGREFERNAAKAQVEIFGSSIGGFLAQVRFLVIRGKLENGARRRLSVREACECVTAESGIGETFEAAAERLRKAYSAHPPTQTAAPLNLGTTLLALAASRIVKQEFLGKKRRRK
jgi:hypothetical protein